jgi:hypothetical protein
VPIPNAPTLVISKARSLINFYLETSVAGDECAVAADIYKCGADKVPEIVHDMVQLAKGSPNIVKSPNFFYL